MEDKKGWEPTKAMLAWTCAGTAALTMIIGFTWGGWVTGGSAEEQAADAAENARAELASAICVERFIGAPDVQARHAALLEESSWSRDGMIEEAGWATPLGLDEPVDGAADLCADQLADMEMEPQVEEAALDAAAMGETEDVAAN